MCSRRSSAQCVTSWTTDHPRRPGPRARRRVPHRDRRGHEGDGDLRPDDPRGYGGLGESLLTYALVVEIARGWMSVSGIINTHFIVAYMIKQHGTDEQKQNYLPRMATGELRGSFSMSEPNCGSDVSAITSRATHDGDGYLLNGQKMWLTNGGSSTLSAVLVRTDEDAPADASVYRKMTTFLIEARRIRRGAPRSDHPREDRQDGLQGRRHHRAGDGQPRAACNGDSGRRAWQGLLPDDGRRRVGRVNVAARACGLSRARLRTGHRLRPAADHLR